MRKQDLREGMFVKLYGGEKCVFIDNRLIEFSKKGTLAKRIGEYNENLTHCLVHCYDIVEVASDRKFKNIIWERKEEVLNEIERDYLQVVIEPFRDKICYIRKREDNRDYDINKEYIEINLVDDVCCLPSFEKGAFYKGMNLKEEYSLEELGL